MKHHKFKFNFLKNLKIVKCRIFGHRLNNNPAQHWCQRCKLCYEDIYSGIGEGYWIESGIIKPDDNLYDEKGNYKNSIEIHGEEYPLHPKVFQFIARYGVIHQLEKLRASGEKLSIYKD